MDLVLIAVFGTLLVGVDAVSAQPLLRRSFGDDTHAFRFILHAQGLTPLQSIADLNDVPQETLLIALGDLSILTQVPAPAMDAFIQNGGAVLLATDSPTPPLIGDLFGARVSEQRVSGNDPFKCYRGMLDCPLVWIGHERIAAFRDLAADRNSALATNRPSYITVPLRRRDRAPLLATSDAAWFDDLLPNGSNTFALVLLRDRTDPDGPQRGVLLADHSIFINRMMLQNDNGNFRFAQTLVRWLTNDGARNKALFLDDGQLQTKFQVLPTDIPDPTQLQPEHLPLPSVDVLNQVLANWQDEDVFNRLILERYSLSQIISGVAFWLSIAFVAYVFYRLWHARYLQDVHP